MSNKDFNRAVDFLQGALNAATRSDAEEQTQPRSETNDLLPGFESSRENVPKEPGASPLEESKCTALEDSFTPPPDADTPPLPGWVTPPEKPVTHLKAVTNTHLKLNPPAKRRAALAAQAAPNDGRTAAFRINATMALAVLSGVLGIGLIATSICLLRTSVPPAETLSNDIPLALLPETADPALWGTVSRMSGEIDGAFLTFEQGMATCADGRTYKLMLDFCRSGSDIYAKVAGDKTYVVRLDELGKITKAYPAPKNNRPLKDIFGR